MPFYYSLFFRYRLSTVMASKGFRHFTVFILPLVFTFFFFCKFCKCFFFLLRPLLEYFSSSLYVFLTSIRISSVSYLRYLFFIYLPLYPLFISEFFFISLLFICCVFQISFHYFSSFFNFQLHFVLRGMYT